MKKFIKIKRKLRLYLDDVRTPIGQIIEYLILFLVLLSTVSFTIGTLPGISHFENEIVYWIDFGCVIIFSFEYILRVIVSRNPIKYVFSLFGIIDFLAILPFYLTNENELLGLRAFRIIKLIRYAKFNKAIKRLKRAFTIVKEEAILFFIVSVIFIYVAACGIYIFEHEAQPEIYKSVIHSLWWSVVTFTTVGYGDAYPITVGGKIFTSVILLGGVGCITFPAALIGSALYKAREEEDEENKRLKSIRELKNIEDKMVHNI